MSPFRRFVQKRWVFKSIGNNTHGKGLLLFLAINERDGILGGYSLHILQPPGGRGGVLCKLRSELRKES